MVIFRLNAQAPRGANFDSFNYQLHVFLSASFLTFEMYRPAPWDDDYIRPGGEDGGGSSSGYNRQPWDSDSEPDDDSDPPWLADSSSDDEDEPRKPYADLFIEEMVSLYLERTLNARHFCTLMHMLGKCGPELQSKCQQYGKVPNGPSGHYERHCKKKLGPFMDEAGTGYAFTMPGRNKHSIGRAEHTLYGSVVHEELNADLCGDQSLKVRLEEAIKDKQFPPAYYEHPIVQQHPDELVLPVNLFVDGVPYSQTDGVIGFWIINCLNGRRYMFLVVRKRLLCECGRRGWCSFHAVFEYINWFLTAMARKRMPNGRHDNKPWHAGLDTERQVLANTDLFIRVALMFIKGDWAEYASTMGFPTWHDSVRPCFGCNASLANLYPTKIHRAIHDREWRENEDDDYFTACDRCEVELEITDQPMYDQLKRIMRYDKKKEWQGTFSDI